MIWLLIVLQIIVVDILLSGDNVVVIAGAANTLPKNIRNLALASGIILALIARVALVSMAGLLIHIKIISVVGGLLLFWVAYKMIKNSSSNDQPAIQKTGDFVTAVLAIIVADLSMSLDNIVAIAGLSKGHPWAMALGLCASLTILGLASRWVSGLMENRRWLNWFGAGLITWVGVTMVI